MEQKGVIYILTNPSFPEYVKIRYAGNIDRRLKELTTKDAFYLFLRLLPSLPVKLLFKVQAISSIRVNG